MKYFLILSLLFMGCGGDGAEINAEDAQAIQREEPVVNPSSYYCEHNGSVYVCVEQDCDLARQEEIMSMEEDTSTKQKSITIGGSVTIIAECGANVSFNLSESFTEVKSDA